MFILVLFILILFIILLFILVVFILIIPAPVFFSIIYFISGLIRFFFILFVSPSLLLLIFLLSFSFFLFILLPSLLFINHTLKMIISFSSSSSSLPILISSCPQETKQRLLSFDISQSANVNVFFFLKAFCCLSQIVGEIMSTLCASVSKLKTFSSNCTTSPNR